MVDQWTGRLDGTVAGWGVAIFVIGMLVIGGRWAFVSVLALLMIGVGGWATIQESFTGARVRSYFGVYTVTDYPETNQRRPAHGTTLHGLQRPDAAHPPAPQTGRHSGRGKVGQNSEY